MKIIINVNGNQMIELVRVINEAFCGMEIMKFFVMDFIINKQISETKEAYVVIAEAILKGDLDSFAYLRDNVPSDIFGKFLEAAIDQGAGINEVNNFTSALYSKIMVDVAFQGGIQVES